MRIILLGLPGAGKGTQAQKLHSRTGIPLVVMGDILRDAIDKKSTVGVQAEGYVNKGQLVPDNLVIQIVIGRLKEQDCEKAGFLLDGFPRTYEQSKALDQEMQKLKTPITHALYYAISDEIAIQRIAGRLICKNCNAIYHLQRKAPTKEGICNTCGNKLSQRKDDTPEVIRQRLQTYHQETAPLLEYYRQKHILNEIPSDRDIDLIFQDTLIKLKIS